MIEDFRWPMGIAEIERCIPHRYPFLLVDRVISCEPGQSIVAKRQVSASDPLLQGHFPGNPIVPGVLIIEGLAQSSAILGKLTKGTCNSCLLLEVENTRFRRMVVPGDVLEYRVQLVKMRKDFLWFAGEAWVDTELATSAAFSARLT